MIQIARCKTQSLLATILIVVWVLVWVCMASDAIAWYPAKYTESAHGNTSYGVNRSGAECPTGTPCPQGECVHCHDTFDDSICGVSPLMLFALNNPTSQTDNLCFQCHCNPVSSEQSSMIENKDYASTFGGGAANSTNIKDAFAFGPPVGNPGSSHNLKKLRNWTEGRSFAPWVTTDTNACVICHNPHVAQKNNNSPYDPTKSAISRPSDHGNVWGDDSTEKMDIYTDKYQAPYWSGSITNGSRK
jgi:hypothetical protein